MKKLAEINAKRGTHSDVYVAILKASNIVALTSDINRIEDHKDEIYYTFYVRAYSSQVVVGDDHFRDNYISELAEEWLLLNGYIEYRSDIVQGVTVPISTYKLITELEEL